MLQAMRANFIGQRYGSLFRLRSCYQCGQPCGLFAAPQGVVISTRGKQHGDTSLNEQGSEIRIASFTDAEKPMFSSCGVLTRHKSQTGVKLPAISEAGGSASHSKKHGCRQIPDAGNFHQAWHASFLRIIALSGASCSVICISRLFISSNMALSKRRMTPEREFVDQFVSIIHAKRKKLERYKVNLFIKDDIILIRTHFIINGYFLQPFSIKS